MAANATSSAATTTSKSNPSKKEKDTLIAVLQFLKKSKLSVSCRSTSSKRQTFFLKNADLWELESFCPVGCVRLLCCSYNLSLSLIFMICNFFKETEKIFRQEVNCLEAIEEINLQTTPDSEPDISSVLSAYNR